MQQPRKGSTSTGKRRRQSVDEVRDNEPSRAKLPSLTSNGNSPTESNQMMAATFNGMIPDFSSSSGGATASSPSNASHTWDSILSLPCEQFEPLPFDRSNASLEAELIPSGCQPCQENAAHDNDQCVNRLADTNHHGMDNIFPVHANTSLAAAVDQGVILSNAGNILMQPVFNGALDMATLTPVFSNSTNAMPSQLAQHAWRSTSMQAPASQCEPVSTGRYNANQGGHPSLDQIQQTCQPCSIGENLCLPLDDSMSFDPEIAAATSVPATYNQKETSAGNMNHSFSDTGRPSSSFFPNPFETRPCADIGSQRRKITASPVVSNKGHTRDTTKRQSTSEVIFTTSLTPNDVLCGRGSGPNNHEGNKNFRKFVEGYKTQYLATSSRQAKAKIAHEIVDHVQFGLNPQGRFLRKIEPRVARQKGYPKGTDVYCTVGEDVALEKVKQALRQNREAKEDSVDDLMHVLGGFRRGTSSRAA